MENKLNMIPSHRINHAQNYKQFIRRDILRIKEVNLTPIGHIKLMAYGRVTISAIRAMVKLNKEFMRMPNNKRWFKFRELCERHSEISNIVPFYRLSFTILNNNGWNKDEKCYL